MIHKLLLFCVKGHKYSLYILDSQKSFSDQEIQICHTLQGWVSTQFQSFIHIWKICYQNWQILYLGWLESILIHVEMIKSNVKASKEKHDAQSFEDAYFELLLWSVLCRKTKLLHFFWSKCRKPLLGALVSGKLFCFLFESSHTLSDPILLIWVSWILKYFWSSNVHQMPPRVSWACFDFFSVSWLFKYLL